MEERRHHIAIQFVLLWEKHFKDKININMVKRAIHGYNECYSVDKKKSETSRRTTLVVNNRRPNKELGRTRTSLIQPTTATKGNC
jgi:hypothetical protein